MPTNMTNITCEMLLKYLTNQIQDKNVGNTGGLLAKQMSCLFCALIPHVKPVEYA